MHVSTVMKEICLYLSTNSINTHQYVTVLAMHFAESIDIKYIIITKVAVIF